MSVRRLLLVLGLFAFCAARADAEVKSFNIAAQPLAKALIAFSEQSNVVVMAPAPLVEGKNAPAVVGEMQPEKALEKLLKGSGLSSKVDEKGTVLIRGATKTADSAVTAVQLDSQLRLARTDDAQAGAAAAGEESEDPQKSTDTKGIPEMLVKGARTSNIDIQRTEDDVQPYVVFTAEDIERSMTGSLDQFLMNRLPMITSQYPAGVISAAPTNGNISSLALRGLGAPQTLILVNGRRMPGVGSPTSLSQPDINGIPMSSVARIEVLPSTAGGIYGGGATGGVINIILKDDYRGMDVSARYDGTFRRDAQQRVLEASGGFSLENGRTTVMLSASHKDSVPLLHADRDFAVRSRQLLVKNTPTLYAGTTIPQGNTSNIRSANGTPLVLASTGQSLGYAFTSVPYGYAGTASDGGAALVANAGQYNLDVTTGVVGLDRALTGAPEVDSLRFNIRRRFTDHIEAFIDASSSTNDSTARYDAVTTNFTSIPARTPNNPFTTPINVRFSANDYSSGADIVATSKMLNYTAGVIVRLPHSWTAQAEYGAGHSENANESDDASQLGILDARVRSGALNILRDVGVYPNDYSAFYGPSQPTTFQPRPRGADLKNLTLRLAGPTVSLPGGPVMLSTLLERREDAVDSSISANFQPVTGVSTYFYTPPRKQTTDGAYVELTAPLISAANTLPLVRALDLQLSYRHDRIGSSTLTNNTQSSITLHSLDDPIPQIDYFNADVEANQYTIGLRYQPLESLTLRVSNSVGVLPPAPIQLSPDIRFNVNNPTLLDPLRGNTAVGIVDEQHNIGDPDLKPEQSNSWSAGAIFTPAFLTGFRLSVDYTHIEKTDEIAILGLQTLLDREVDYPGRVGRLPLTDADRLQGYEGGHINYLNAGYTNISHTKVEAYDFNASYQWTTPYGTFRAEAIATHQIHLQKQLVSNAPVSEFIGFANGPLPWRGNAGLTWERAAWTVGWNTQYFDPFPVYDNTTNAATRAMFIQAQGAEYVPHQIYHDLSFKYRIDEAPLWGGLFADSSVLVGISNVFDTEPPLMLWTGLTTVVPGTTVRFADPRMRRYSISLRKSFK